MVDLLNSLDSVPDVFVNSGVALVVLGDVLVALGISTGY